MSFDSAQSALTQAIQLHQSGSLDQAESLYRQLISTVPETQTPSTFSACCCFKRATHGRPRTLAAGYQIRPLRRNIPSNFGSALAQDGQIQEAIRRNSQAPGRYPNDPQAHFNLAHLLENCEQWDDAAAAYRRAIELRPDFAPAHNNLGNILYSLGRSQEAEASYRAALSHRPLDPRTHKNLGRALDDLGRLSEAAKAYSRAMELDPHDSETHSNLGTVLASSRRFDDAIVAYQRALSIRPDDTTAMTNLGNALKDIGRVDEAIAWFTRALELSADARTGSCLNVAVHLHPDYDPPRIWQVHEQWEARFARPLAPIGDFFPKDPSPTRPLRIGYVSPGFSDHIVGHCIIGLLSNHDHNAFEIYCYSDMRRPDWMTERLRATADVWRNTVGLSDEQLTSLIRRDKVDILVDLNMHMERNRMLVFARKAAPVQITWIGYPGTTGLKAMDYRLSDPYLDPPGPDGAAGPDDQFYSEKTMRLPDSYWCYQPLDDLPPANELPALRNGYITFGCLNSFVKVSQPSLRLWARVLHEVQTSTLVLLAPESSARQRRAGRFQQSRNQPCPHRFLRPPPAPSIHGSVPPARSGPRHNPLQRTHHHFGFAVDGCAGRQHDRPHRGLTRRDEHPVERRTRRVLHAQRSRFCFEGGRSREGFRQALRTAQEPSPADELFPPPRRPAVRRTSRRLTPELVHLNDEPTEPELVHQRRVQCSRR